MNNTIVMPNGFVIPMPLPPPQPTMAAFFYFLMAGLICRSFFKKMDWEVQQADEFKKLEPWMQAIVKKLMDFLHHWWMGYGLMVFASEIALYLPQTPVEVYWVGFAVLLDDLPDAPARVRKLFEKYNVLGRKEGE